MFDLTTALDQWRRDMIATGIGRPDPLRELEEHLREDIDAQVRNGKTPADAFRDAVTRLGAPDVLRSEFDLGSGPGIRRGLRHLYKHRAKLLAFFAAGVLAAVIVNLGRPGLYVSESKLLLRYQIDPSRVLPATQQNDAAAETATKVRVTASDPQSAAARIQAVNTFTSFELAERVAGRIGPSKIAGLESSTDLLRAGKVIQQGLIITAKPSSSVLEIQFRHPDSTLVQPVLREVISTYLQMHLEKSRRLDEVSALGKISNISSIQAPTTALFDVFSAYVPAALIVSTSLAAGVLWIAFAAWRSAQPSSSEFEAG